MVLFVVVWLHFVKVVNIFLTIATKAKEAIYMVDNLFCILNKQVLQLPSKSTSQILTNKPQHKTKLNQSFEALAIFSESLLVILILVR